MRTLKGSARVVVLMLVTACLGLIVNQLSAGVRLVIIHERNLYTIDEFGGQYRTLTDSAQYPKWEPRFSPDGKWIAFFIDIYGNKELWIQNYVTGDARLLASRAEIGWIPYGDGGPAWSADGAWIYFGISNSAGDCEVGRIKLDKTGFTPLTDIPGYNTQSFDISPVSSLSTFVRGYEGSGYSNKLFIDNLDFTEPIPIQGQFAPHRPRISPDGQMIAYTGGDYTVRLINIDGSGDKLLVDSGYPVCWHPNGTKLLICQGDALYWIDLDGQNKTFLANGWWATACDMQFFKANAGENITINSDARPNTVLQGSVSLSSDTMSDLNYRWKEGDTVHCEWMAVDSEFRCPLDLASFPLQIGTHALTLEVSDGADYSSDEMILTIENSAPHAAANGGGVLELPGIAVLGGYVSDFDGDILHYRWLEDGVQIDSDVIQANVEGQPMRLTEFRWPLSNLGEYVFRLEVSDSINPPATSDVKIRVIDTTAPTISPVSSATILWPPNHQFVDVLIKTNAADGSGTITIAATITSNEALEGLGDGDMSPDWTMPIIDQQSGDIRFKLRAERAGSGNGRTYTILISASDSSNNASSVSLEIIVPHDKKR